MPKASWSTRSARCCGRAWPAACCGRSPNSTAPTSRRCTTAWRRSTGSEHLRAGAHAGGRCARLRRRHHPRALRRAAGQGRGRRHACARKGSERPSVDVEQPDVRINLSLRKGRATISIDLGGGPMHRRGWRNVQNEAPLKENLAAAVLMRGGWPSALPRRRRAARPDVRQRHAADRRRADGRRRRARACSGTGAACRSRWLGFDAEAWKRAGRRGASSARHAGASALKPAFFGSDIDPHAIRAARENASAPAWPTRSAFERARRRRNCRRRRSSAAWWSAIRPTTSAWPPTPRCTASSAMRCGARCRSGAPACCAAMPSWRYATGLRASKKYQLFNGAIECALIVCDPVGAARSANRATPRQLSEGAQMVANRLRKNLRKFKTWRERDGVTLLPRLRRRPARIRGGHRRLHRGRRARRAPSCTCRNTPRPTRFPKPTCAAASASCWPPRARCSRVPREQIAVKTRERGKGGSKYGRMRAARRVPRGARKRARCCR